MRKMPEQQLHLCDCHSSQTSQRLLSMLFGLPAVEARFDIRRCVFSNRF